MESSDKSQVTTVILDRHPLFRESLRFIVEKSESIKVIGEASDLETALHLISTQNPDVVLLDLLCDHDMSSDHIRALSEVSPDTHVVVIAGAEDDDATKRAVLGRAQGIVHTSVSVETLLKAIKKVSEGEAWFERRFTAQLITEAANYFDDKEVSARMIRSLTARERQIISNIAAGSHNKEIAARLNITEKTVRNALTVIFLKLGVRSRLELALFAEHHGIVPIH